MNGGVEQQRDVRLVHNQFEDKGIKHHGIALGIPKEILDKQFIKHAAFARPAVVIAHVRSRPQNPQAHFARSIATENGAILHEHDLAPGAGRGDGRTHTGQSAANHGHVHGATDRL